MTTASKVGRGWYGIDMLAITRLCNDDRRVCTGRKSRTLELAEPGHRAQVPLITLRSAVMSVRHDRELDLALLGRFAPIVRFTEGEYFLPISIDDYLPRCQLRHRIAGGSSIVADIGALDRHRLATITDGDAEVWSLEFAPHPMPRHERLAWTIRPERPRFSGANRLGSVGVMSRLVDSAMRSTLLVRGRVAPGTAAAAEVICREIQATGHHPYYGRVVRDGGWTVLQYWFFYGFNDWRSRVNGVNDHEADWEQVTIFLAPADGADGDGDGDDGTDRPLEPAWVAFSAHDEVGAELRRRWDDPDLTAVGDHPVVFAGLGSHSGAYLAGDYLVTVGTGGFRRVHGLARRLAHRLLPWTRDGQSPDDEVGIPYIDYHRGDGIALGTPERPWVPELVDDSTPWVSDYVGLWGQDTNDPFGGERGPAGPKYERDGTIRKSWADPLSWAGLETVVPDRRARRATIRATVDRLDAALASIDEERAALRSELRGAALADVDGGTLEPGLARLGADRARLTEHRRRLLNLDERGTDAAGPHDHLRKRKVPIEPPTAQRRRLLRLWASVSTPLLLGALAVLALPLGPSTSVLGGITLVTVFGVEALARKSFTSFLVAVVFTAVATAVTVGLVLAALEAWRITLAGVLGAAAVAVLALNLSELRRR
jgi:hypothetical protein